MKIFSLLFMQQQQKYKKQVEVCDIAHSYL